MAYKFNSNRLKIDSEFNNKTSTAIRLMLDAIHAESTPHTPKKDGPLRDHVQKRVQGNSGSIVWPKKYAMVQEKAPGNWNYTTPGTGPKFAENAARKIADNSDQYFKRVGL